MINILNIELLNKTKNKKEKINNKFDCLNKELQSKLIDVHALDKQYVAVTCNGDCWIFDICYRIMYETLYLKRSSPLSYLEYEDNKIKYTLILSLSECMSYVQQSIPPIMIQESITKWSVEFIIDIMKVFLIQDIETSQLYNGDDSFINKVKNLYSDNESLKIAQYESYKTKFIDMINIKKYETDPIDNSFKEKLKKLETKKYNISYYIPFAEFSVIDFIKNPKSVSNKGNKRMILIAKYKRGKFIANTLKMFKGINIINIESDDTDVYLIYSVTDINKIDPALRKEISEFYKIFI